MALRKKRFFKEPFNKRFFREPKKVLLWHRRETPLLVLPGTFFFKSVWGRKSLTCRLLRSYSGLFCFINSNIINKVINISLIILLVFIIIEFGPPMSLF